MLYHRLVPKKEVKNMNQKKPDIDDMIFAEEEARVSDR